MGERKHSVARLRLQHGAGRGAHAEQFRVGIADGDFHREALRDVDPVNAFLDQRQPFDDAPTFGQDPEPTESTTR